MKIKISVITLVALLITSTAMSQEEESWQEKLKRQLSNENVSKTLGSIAGALLGTQVGSGKGRIAAIAVGTLAGYWLGGKLSARLSGDDKRGIAEATEKAMNTGETTTWRNPDTGMVTKVSVGNAPSGSGQDIDGQLYAVAEVPQLEFVNSYYRPSTNLNVRSGPSPEYRVLHTLSSDTLVPVIGRVADKKWFLISENGAASGFVYAPLMELEADQTQAGNALRHSMSVGVQPERYEIVSQRCRNITQEVTLSDGSNDSHTFKACQQSDGSWLEV